MKFELSFDDGLVEDQIIVEKLNKYNLEATFYVPVESYGFKFLSIYKGQKLGGHTITHPSDLKRLDYAEKQREIRVGKSMLEEAAGFEVASFCYPRGRHDLECRQLVRMAGYKEARTTIVLKTDFADPYAKPTTLHMYPRKEYNQATWYELALKIFEQNPPYFHLWGHSKELIQHGYLDQFTNFLKFVNENRDRLEF